MSSIWVSEGDGWRLLTRAGFPLEAELHALVEKAPEILPLAGSPRLAVVGKEVRLGSGSADLIAVEPSGRLAVIEVKLARNSEARRAVVAQVLSYASYLHGMDRDHLESVVLSQHLRERGHESLFSAAIEANEEEATEDARRRFEENLDTCLTTGRFRLVIVLDDAPGDLVRLIGYMEEITDNLVIDLITVASFDVGDRQVIVPTRVEPERWTSEYGVSQGGAGDSSDEPGAGAFIGAIDTAPEGSRQFLREVVDWAQGLEHRGLAGLMSFFGAQATVLRIYVTGNRSLVTANFTQASACLQFYRSVFEDRAPTALARIEGVTGLSIGQGTAVRELQPGLLPALTAAYEEAASTNLTVPPHSAATPGQNGGAGR